ncbi:MAG: hypothetical protein EOM72_13690 [Opitutae bacterium]|nr:hypothetical protein [Opitutae bacterium]
MLGVHVAQRTKHTAKVQQILSDYGCSIRTRLGLHEADDNVCSPNGLILLEVVSRAGALAQALAKVPGVTVKKMVFGE